MTTTEWQWRGRFIVTDLVKGNALAAIIDPDVGGNETFSKGMRLRPIGSSSETPSAWYSSSLLMANAIAFIDEFLGAGPYPKLTSLGLSGDQIAAFQAVFKITYGTPADMEAGAMAWIAAQGYEPIPASSLFA